MKTILGLIIFVQLFFICSLSHAGIFKNTTHPVSKWNVGTDASTPIMICFWDSDSMDYSDQLEDAINSSWGSHGIYIKMVGLCSDVTSTTDQEQTVGWQFSDSVTPNAEIGMGLCTATSFPDPGGADPEPCMISGPSPNNLLCVEASKGSSEWDACFDQYAIHEFGHVLGFAHEFIRWDRPCDCTIASSKLPSSLDSYILLPDYGDYGNYDSKSIMTYNKGCIDSDPDSVRFGSSNLSDGDIAALQTIYGGGPLDRSKKDVADASVRKAPDQKRTVQEQTENGFTSLVPDTKKIFCHQGTCIPDSDNPHHPKYHLNDPIEKGPEPKWPPSPSLSSDGTLYIHFTRSGKKKRTIDAGGHIVQTVECNNPEETANNSIMYESKYERWHWTVSCWVEASGSDWTKWRCQNWNTHWGDPHDAEIKGICKPCRSTKDCLMKADEDLTGHSQSESSRHDNHLE